MLAPPSRPLGPNRGGAYRARAARVIRISTLEAICDGYGAAAPRSASSFENHGQRICGSKG